MYDDPIVAEVRRIRSELFASFGNDIDRFFAEMRRRQAEHPELLVSFPSRPVQSSPQRATRAQGLSDADDPLRNRKSA